MFQSVTYCFEDFCGHTARHKQAQSHFVMQALMHAHQTAMESVLLQRSGCDRTQWLIQSNLRRSIYKQAYLGFSQSRHKCAAVDVYRYLTVCLAMYDVLLTQHRKKMYCLCSCQLAKLYRICPMYVSG